MSLWDGQYVNMLTLSCTVTESVCAQNQNLFKQPPHRKICVPAKERGNNGAKRMQREGFKTGSEDALAPVTWSNGAVPVWLQADVERYDVQSFKFCLTQNCSEYMLLWMNLKHSSSTFDSMYVFIYSLFSSSTPPCIFALYYPVIYVAPWSRKNEKLGNIKTRREFL